MKQKIITLAATMLFTLGLSSTSQANLLTNGSFESPLVGTGYRSGSHTWDYFSASSVSGWQGSNIELWVDGFLGKQAYDGKQFAELNAHPYTGTSFSIFQTFDTVVGQQYQLSFAYGARRSNRETFRVEAGDLDTLISDHTVGKWSSYNNMFTATGTQTTLRFTSVLPEKGTLGNFLDDVSVTAVPEPTSMALLGIGLFGLTVLRKRDK